MTEIDLDCEFYPGPNDGCVCAAGSDIAGSFFCTKEYSQECQWAKERRRQEPKLHMRHKKMLIIDATDYPFIRVTKPISLRGALDNLSLYNDEEKADYFFLSFYDYQPEDLEGGDKNG